MKVLPWKTLSTKHIVKDRWISLRADRCETPGGRILDPYYVQEPSDWVHVLAFDAKNQIILTRQYRHGTSEICTELPCGSIEPGETALQAAKRHLLNKTGYSANSFEELPSACPNPACYSNKIVPFCALNVLKFQEQKAEFLGEIEFYFASIEQLLNLIEGGEFQQPLHTASVFVALRKRGLLSVKASSILK